MLSTIRNKVFKESSRCTNKELTILDKCWTFTTNYDKKTNNQENYLVSYNNLVENINEAKVDPYKLQEQCYINNTTKVALGLSANEKEVLGAIYGVTHDSGVGYLTNKYISNATRLSISSIKRYLNKFENLGLIVRKYERNGLKVIRNYEFTELFFKVSELSGNKCVKRPDIKTEVNESQNLHKMATKPITAHGSNWSINNTSIILDNISTNILSNNKVNISINTYTKVNTEYSKLKQRVDKKLRTKNTQRNKLVSYNEMIDNFVDLNYKEGQQELKEVLRKRLQVIYGTRKHIKNKLKLTNKELKSTLEKLLKLSKGNAGKALTIVQYSNTQYYSDIYEPNLKTCIAYKDKAYANIIKRVDSINSTLNDNDSRYEENLILKYKSLDKLSTWYKVRNNLLPMMRPVYDGTHHFEEVDNMLNEFTRVNGEYQQTELDQTGERRKIEGIVQNSQGAGVPLYDSDRCQIISNNASLYIDNYRPRSSYGPTYDLERYEKTDFTFNYINNEEDEDSNAYDTCICNSESNEELRERANVDLTKKCSTLNTERVTPPPNCGSPPSPCEREYVIRPKLSDLRGVNEEKCKSIPPGTKQGLKCVKTVQNEKVEKEAVADPEFVKKCIKEIKEKLMRKGPEC